MRGRKAKLIRHMARKMTVGQPAREYEWQNAKVDVRDRDGKPVRDENGKIRKRWAHRVVVKAETTRGTYLRLKKAYAGRPFHVY